MCRFIESLLLKADRECVHGPARLFLHQRDNRGRIGTARQKGADQHARYHLAADRVSQQRFEFVGDFVITSMIERALPGGGDLAQIPIAGLFRFFARCNAEDVRGRQLPGIL